MANKEKSLQEIFEDIQKYTKLRETAINDFTEEIYCRLLESRKYYDSRNTSGETFSDVFQNAIKSFLSDIKNNRRIDSVIDWNSFAFAYLRKKVYAHFRKKSRDRLILDDSFIMQAESPPEKNQEEYTQFVETIANLLPSEDNTAEVFREVMHGENTQIQIANKLGISEKTVTNKISTVRNHFVDILLDETELDPAIRKAIEFIIDPRTNIEAEKQGPGKRLSEMERRINAAADEIGMDKTTMRNFVLSAFRKLARVLNESCT